MCDELQQGKISFAKPLFQLRTCKSLCRFENGDALREIDWVSWSHFVIAEVQRQPRFGEFGEGKFLHSEASWCVRAPAVAKQPGPTVVHVDLSHPNFFLNHKCKQKIEQLLSAHTGNYISRTVGAICWNSGPFKVLLLSKSKLVVIRSQSVSLFCEWSSKRKKLSSVV